MQDADDVDRVPAQRVDHDAGQGRHDEFARASFLPGLPRFGNINKVAGASYSARTRRSARTAGYGEFHTTDGSGRITLLKAQPNWRTTWDLIVPGNFGGSPSTDLLFYDRETGTGQFYATDGGAIHELRAYTNWRKSWDLIVPGDFGGDGRTDLLFYDRPALVRLQLREWRSPKSWPRRFHSRETHSVRSWYKCTREEERPSGSLPEYSACFSPRAGRQMLR